ncbi:hypothetical protein TUM20983_00470 [Mycobacterium antarcticum]|uniref:HAD family hydrolase n=1 Tax=Mycolicibacterium sp. TUM20983 TaxID=3023369 RepID=UPI00239B86DC|nr:HAD family hydrolase [Mycolicibacterium sp. TUM20983]GLP72937.1 hypothetical protein TUM20983_00470 [Mycolicibacterium sp. TUM20983]
MPTLRDTSTLIATDLDRTMIFSVNAIGDAVTDDRLLCVEQYDGAPLSYMTRAGAAALSDLSARAFVVPTTTRTVAQFNRIELPGAPWPYAITSNGGNILVDGVPDPGWGCSVADAMREGGASLLEVTTELGGRISSTWVDKLRVADDLFCYLVIRPDALPGHFLPAWGRWCADRSWTVSRQGRKIYVMPKAVCKSHAVAEVRSRLVSDGAVDPDVRVVAAGDGGLDAEMLVAADAGIRPRHGELEDMRWGHPTVRVTASAGILAGEEILSWFSDAVAAPAVRL